jgi:CheY-like chemotaxis protein/DNA-binding PadR family transcriptional regulator
MSVPHVLLRLLLEGPSHGYDLHQRLGAFHTLYPLRNVNVYPTLRSLEEQGFVRSHRELCDSRMRKVYEITPDGSEELGRWIASAPDVSISSEKDLVALKLVLARRSDSEGLGWLADTLGGLDQEIHQTRAFIEEQLRGNVSPLTLLTAEYRLRSYEQRRQYLLEAMRITLGREKDRAGEEQAPHRAPGKRILVVDDSIAARVTSRHLLSAAGYEVRLAEDGAQAWELLQEAEFDLVVSDAMMPVLDGFGLLERVRAHSELADLPVIMNTVLEDANERDAALAAGANDFVCKKDADAARRLVDSVDRLTGGALPN